MEDLDEAPENEVDAAEQEVLDQATAARSIAELKAEIETLKALEALALEVRRSGTDTKWRELASLLGEVFTVGGLVSRIAEPDVPYGAGEIPQPTPSPRQKLVIFTEHRDTLSYLHDRITSLLGREGSVVTIHGGVGREDRLKAQEAFRHDPQVQVLLATDAAGEGINLQRAHLMVNYDLPWNPNRLEQRFGRIHRIGQTEVCHLWNLVADETREGDVYRKLLEKLEQARQSLGGQVFDVLGKLHFEGAATARAHGRGDTLRRAAGGPGPPRDRGRPRPRPWPAPRTCWKSGLLRTTPWTQVVCSASARTWCGPKHDACSRTTSSRSSAKRSSDWAAPRSSVRLGATRLPTYRRRFGIGTA